MPQPNSDEWKSQIKNHEQKFKEIKINREKQFIKNFSDQKR